MGVSRSATVVIAYLMQHRSMSLVEAYAHVKERRPMINPNAGFWKQLDILFEQRLKRTHESTDKAVKMPIGKDKTTFARYWAETSLATYQTIGHIISDPSELFHEINTDCDLAEILYCAMDFVFGRGVLEADLFWLSALCASYRALGVEPMPMIDIIFTEGSKFMDMWCGEVYPESVEKIKASCSTEKDDKP